MFQQRKFPQPKPKENPHKCRIVIKRKKDGTTIKEIEGNCTTQQLKALSNQNEIEED